MKVLLLIAAALPFITGVKLVGGPQTYTTNLRDPNVIFAVNAINEFYKTNGDQRLRVGEKVVGATLQIVAGMRYVFLIKVKVGDVFEMCTITVWSKPWLAGNDSLSVIGTPDCHPEV